MGDFFDPMTIEGGQLYDDIYPGELFELGGEKYDYDSDEDEAEDEDEDEDDSYEDEDEDDDD